MDKLKRYFITGLIVFLPAFLTIYVILAILKFLDNILGRYINIFLYHTLGFKIFGLGILLFAILVFLSGVFAVNFLGKRILPALERFFVRIPLVHEFYPAIKQMVIFLFSEKHQSFKSVALVEYPRKGIYSIGFITNDGVKQIQDKVGIELINVFIASSPNPLTGFLVLVRKEEVQHLELSIEEGMKLLISGGIINP